MNRVDVSDADPSAPSITSSEIKNPEIGAATALIKDTLKRIDQDISTLDTVSEDEYDSGLAFNPQETGNNRRSEQDYHETRKKWRSTPGYHETKKQHGDEAAKALFVKALKDVNGNRTHAAILLQVSRKTLQKILQELFPREEGEKDELTTAAEIQIQKIRFAPKEQIAKALQKAKPGTRQQVFLKICLDKDIPEISREEMLMAAEAEGVKIYHWNSLQKGLLAKHSLETEGETEGEELKYVKLRLYDARVRVFDEDSEQPAKEIHERAGQAIPTLTEQSSRILECVIGQYLGISEDKVSGLTQINAADLPAKIEALNKELKKHNLAIWNRNGILVLGENTGIIPLVNSRESREILVHGKKETISEPVQDELSQTKAALAAALERAKVAEESKAEVKRSARKRAEQVKTEIAALKNSIRNALETLMESHIPELEKQLEETRLRVKEAQNEITELRAAQKKAIATLTREKDDKDEEIEELKEKLSEARKDAAREIEEEVTSEIQVLRQSLKMLESKIRGY